MNSVILWQKFRNYPLSTFINSSKTYCRLKLARKYPAIAKKLLLAYRPAANPVQDKREASFAIFLSDRTENSYPSDTAFFKTFFSNEFNSLLDSAEQIIKGHINVLGSYELDIELFRNQTKGSVQFGKVPWNCDFVSGFCWDKSVPFFDVKYGGKEGVDVKIPWELSRFEYALTLGQAYYLTGDERFAQKFVELISDWIAENPTGFGVNWCCTMEVAIRACNWLAAWPFFKNSSAIDDNFATLFFQSIYKHGQHISANLEWTSNHFLADLTGLLYIAEHCPHFKGSEKWKKIAFTNIKKELKRQVHDDGFDFEASVSYHRLVTDFYFFALWIGKLKQVSLPDWFTKRIKTMCEVMASLVMPNGLLPQIGDTDSGRLHILGQRENRLDCRDILGLASVFFNDSSFKFNEWPCPSEIFWLFGEKGVERWQKLKGKSYCSRISKKFSDSGIYVLNKRNTHAVISCGPNGQYKNGGHAHNDKLSLNLVMDGVHLVTDTGSYVYTRYPELRNKFRSTGVHSTVTLNGEEQNRLGPGLFSMHDDAKAHCIKWLAVNDEIIFEGQHYGYLRLPEKAVHNRRFSLKGTKLFIVDSIYSIKKINTAQYVKFAWHLPLAPGIEINTNTGNVDSLQLDDKNGHKFCVGFSRKVPANISLGQYSPTYGKIHPILCIDCNLEAELPFCFSWWIGPNE